MSETVQDPGIWLHLLDGQGNTACLLEFTFRPDTMTVWLKREQLATIDREIMRRWLQSGEDPLTTDKIVWTFEGHRLAISIGLRPKLLVPEVFTLELAALV